MMKKKKEKTNYDAYKVIRRDWDTISPITKVIPDKRKKKPKYKNKEEDA